MLGNTQICFLIVISLLLQLSRNWCIAKEFNSSGVNISAVDYSPDGAMIAVGGMSDNTTAVYDATTYKIIMAIPAPAGSGFVTALKFNPNSTLLAIGYSTIGRINLFNVIGNSVIALINTTQPTIALDFDSNSTILAVCCPNFTVLYSIVPGANFSAIKTNFPGTCVGVSFTYDSAILTLLSNGSVAQASSPNYAFNISKNYVYSGLTCFAYKWGNFSTYDYIMGCDPKLMIIFANSTNYSNIGSLSCAYSRALDFLAVGGSTKNLTIFTTSVSLDSSYALQGKIQAMDFSNDGVFLVVGTSDGTVHIYTQNCNLTCDDQSYYDLTSKACTLCSLYLKGCGKCYNRNACSICSQSYYLDENRQCLSCY
jgi:WD40 repeat protein